MCERLSAGEGCVLWVARHFRRQKINRFPHTKQAENNCSVNSLKPVRRQSSTINGINNEAGAGVPEEERNALPKVFCQIPGSMSKNRQNNEQW